MTPEAGLSTECLFDTVPAVVWLTNEAIERWRRSLAMLSPGQSAGISREEAIELLEELQRCRSRGRQLLYALREIGTIVDRTLRAAGGRGPEVARSSPPAGKGGTKAAGTNGC